ncbi:hypothetical protein YQE_11666, partial [Dendroctonus ponderosae]
MRWGVRDEATDDHMTTELCMKEIQNCQRLSMGPNFVVFLGQKYGYRPIPTYILSSELQLIRDELHATGHDVLLIDTWYRKDSNAVPPISVLQPISSILINFNNKVRNLETSALYQLTYSVWGIANSEAAGRRSSQMVGYFSKIPKIISKGCCLTEPAGENG